jgi:hypothetical protein
MKTRTLISLVTLALAAASSGCSAETQPQSAAADEPTGKTDQAQLIGMTGNIMAWPAGPIVWNGLNATWPINVWSPNPIGAIAFDVAGMTNLGLTVAGNTALTASTITTPWLNAFVPAAGVPLAVGAPLAGAGGLYAPGYGYGGLYAPYTGLAGYGYGAFSSTAALQSTYLNGALTPGWSTWFTPALTNSALMFTTLPTLTALTPFTFNVTFAAQSAAQATAVQTAAISNAAALSIFATPILPSALATATLPIPFMSMAFPILPLTPLLPVTTATTLPALTAGTLL